ncbi:MAG: hypothetical protein AB8B63_19095 [Granulosicoccus sp.]
MPIETSLEGAEVLPAAPAETSVDDSEVEHSVSELVRKISAEPNNNARSTEALSVPIAELQNITLQESMQAELTDSEAAVDETQPAGVEDTVVNEPPETDVNPDLSVAVEPAPAQQVRSGGLLMGMVRRFLSWVRRIVGL